MGLKVQGTTKIKRNISKMAKAITNGSDKGIKKVAKTVQRAVGWSGGQPLIPVRTGNLRDSWFMIPYKSRGGERSRSVRFGYRARYSHYQHDPQKYTKTWNKWVYTREGSGRNYMRSTVNEMARSGSMKKIIERNIRKQIR